MPKQSPGTCSGKGHCTSGLQTAQVCGQHTPVAAGSVPLARWGFGTAQLAWKGAGKVPPVPALGKCFLAALSACPTSSKSLALRDVQLFLPLVPEGQGQGQQCLSPTELSPAPPAMVILIPPSWDSC